MRYIFFFWIAVSSMISYGQGTLVADYRLDNCSADDFHGPHDGFILGTPCECGVRADGFRMNGTSHFVEFSPTLTPTFSGDFSLSFYVRFVPEDGRPMDVFSIAERCAADSVLLIRYLPDLKQLRIRMSSSPDNSFSLNAQIDDPSCWSYIVFTKENAIGTLYVNGVLADQSASISDLRLNVDAPFALANSPCTQVSSDVRFRGDIDEIRVYDGALTERQIEGADLRPDRILTRDTTIFVGESILIETGGTCAMDFSWSPADGLSSDMTLNPVATPTSPMMTYTLRVEYDDCVVTDDVTINVVDPSEVTCADLLLPNAFTPNDDGVNDTYGVSNRFLIDEFLSFEIFDKWGGRVFGTRDLGIQWNGTKNNGGAPVDNSTYVYKVTYVCSGEEYVKTGTVNLIR